jgi:hypothetical protein
MRNINEYLIEPESGLINQSSAHVNGRLNKDQAGPIANHIAVHCTKFPLPKNLPHSNAPKDGLPNRRGIHRIPTQTCDSLLAYYKNVVVTRTFSKAFSLAGCRIGYAVANKELIGYLNSHNDAYPLARSSEAAAIESLKRFGKIKERICVHKIKEAKKDYHIL